MKTSSLLLLSLSAISFSAFAQDYPDGQILKNREVNAQQACLERGAQPGTIGFDRCMQSQMQPKLPKNDPHRHQVSLCFSPVEQRYIQNECEHMQVNGDIQHCVSILTARCEWLASKRHAGPSINHSGPLTQPAQIGKPLQSMPHLPPVQRPFSSNMQG